MTADESVVKTIASLVGTVPMGRAQKTRGNRFDVLLPTTDEAKWSKGEVKLSVYHPYGNGGFRHGFSNLFGHGEGNDAEHYILVGVRRIPFNRRTSLDKKYFFLFFSRSELLGICTGQLNLRVNWEPGGARPKDRSDTALKNAAICRAVVYAEDLRNIHLLVAAHPNEPYPQAKTRTRRTMTRFDREVQVLQAQVADLEVQRDDAHRRLQLAQARNVIRLPSPSRARDVIEQRLSRRAVR
ncbi:hypothetical protein [Variovorax sp. LARHSF232]